MQFMLGFGWLNAALLYETPVAQRSSQEFKKNMFTLYIIKMIYRYSHKVMITEKN